MPKIKVAVIGTGAAGLCAGRHLIADPETFEFDIFEQQHDVGGTWRYSYYIGKDQYGLPVHSSMYKNLKTNLPKELMAFPDFPFEDFEGRSFLHHTQVLGYLEDYAKHFNLYQHIKFHKQIENVRPFHRTPDGAEEWSVSVVDVVTRERETHIYDAVMVCNGHYSVPYIPEIAGLKEFEGLLVHSHDYRDPLDFKDMKVVVLGAGASGIDIGIEIAAAAKEVILSHNTPPKVSVLPPNLRQLPGISSLQRDSVTFLNGGESYRCDSVVLCTGYLYHYPFLDPSCGLEFGDQKVTPLYLHLFCIEHPSLAIWAVPKLILPFPIYHQQTKLFLKVLKKEVLLPSKETMREEMEADFSRRVSEGYGPRHMHLMRGEYHWEYDDTLSSLGQIEPLSQAVRNLLRHILKVRPVNLLNYKNDNYRLEDGAFVKTN